MINSVKQYIRRNEMPMEGSVLIVGLSGGADSVVLLHILNQLGYHCIASHCNFNLRGEESDRDEQFAVKFADSMGIPIDVVSFDTRQYAVERKISIEMAARELRYKWFEKLRVRENAAAIAVAHHSDDNIETLFINLIRGTGLKGLTGMKPQNEHVIRPFLCVSKAEILAYLHKNNLSFVTDSSNLENEYIRNKIRNKIIPLLEEINPSIRETLSRTMENLRQSELLIRNTMAECRPKMINGNKIWIDELKKYPASEAVLFEMLSEYGFNPEVIKEIAAAIDKQSGKVFYSPQYRLTTGRTHFLITEKIAKDETEYLIKKNTVAMTQPLSIEIDNKTSSSSIEILYDKKVAYLDMDKLQFPLILRKWRSGDRFKPFGMKGFQKLSDFFNNNKFDLPDKEAVWILCSGNDICWVVGYRIDDRFRVESSTKNVYILKVL